MELNKENRDQELYNSIINKCWEDASFTQKLVANPSQTISDTFGSKFTAPKGKKLVVLDQTNSSVININIPAMPAIEDLELTDEQLEAVAGGGTPIVYGIAVGVALLAGAAYSWWTHD
jgi:hypothetical protein